MATDKHQAKTDLLPAILVALGVVGVGGWIAVTATTDNASQSKLATESIDLERPAKDLRLQQQGELVAPAVWADKTKGTASIPVDRAMALVVKTLQLNPAAATPAPPAPKEPDADGGADAAPTDVDGGAEGAATGEDGGAAAADAGTAAEAAAPVAPKPVAPKPAPAPAPPNPTPETP